MLEKQVTAFIKQKRLIDPGDSCLVGVSGGPDSIALLAYMKELIPEYGLTIMVAHVDHMFRGEESYKDYQYVEEMCAKWNLPFKGTRVNVPDYIKQTGKNPQQASRDCRYAHYKAIMKEYSVKKLVLAHHLDDQAETVLMNLIRGSTGKARMGIPVKRSFAGGEIIRPFLAVTRQEIMDYCERMNLSPRFDPSNEKDLYTRNRFRKYILPLIKQENEQALNHIQRFSEEVEQDEDYLQSLAQERFESLGIERDKDKWIVEIPRLSAVPKPLQRRVIQLILNYLYQVKPYMFSSVHIDSIQSLLVESHPSISLQLPHGLRVTKAYERLLFHFGELPVSTFSNELCIPGLTTLENGYVIETALWDGAAEEMLQESADACTITIAKERLPLLVRNRRDGDRYQPKGFAGHKKLKKLFVERRIPIHLRDSWPIVTDKNGVIVWIPGLQQVSAEYSPNAINIMVKYTELSSSRRTTE